MILRSPVLLPGVAVNGSAADIVDSRRQDRHRREQRRNHVIDTVLLPE
jgi:hypothetical protein